MKKNSEFWVLILLISVMTVLFKFIFQDLEDVQIFIIDLFLRYFVYRMHMKFYYHIILQIIFIRDMCFYLKKCKKRNRKNISVIMSGTKSFKISYLPCSICCVDFFYNWIPVVNFSWNWRKLTNSHKKQN